MRGDYNARIPKDVIDKSQTNKPTESPDYAKRKEVREFLDTLVEHILSSRSEYLNEGNNGLVVKFQLFDLDPEYKEAFAAEMPSDGVKETRSFATKILKVYQPGKGEQEYEIQKRAYEIAQQAAQAGGEWAQVPKPWFYRNLSLTPETAQRIRGMGKGMKINQDAEVMIMDYVPGDDLATILFKEVVKHHPKLVHLVPDVDNMRFDALQEAVAFGLEFKAPGGKSRDEGERIFEERRVFAENAQKIYDFLKKRGVVLHPNIAEQMQNTIKALHQNGVFVLDAHERNFLITGDHLRGGKTAPQVFMIDYGEAKMFESNNIPVSKEAIYVDSLGRQCTPEDATVSSVRKLVTTTSEDEAKKYGASTSEFLETRRDRLNSKLIKDYLKKYRKKIISGKFEYYDFSMCPDQLGRADNFMVILLSMMEKGSITEEQVKNLLDKVIKGQTILSDHNNLVRLYVQFFKKKTTS